MRIQVKTRKLSTPQTNSKTGAVLKDLNGDPVYTTYIRGADPQYRLRKHMKRYFDRIVSVLQQIDSDGGDLPSVLNDTFHLDINHKSQKGCDPYPKDWLTRFEMVDKYLNGREVNNDLTMGVIDDYNIVVSEIYMSTVTDGNDLDRMLIEIYDSEQGQYMEMLNPDLFEE